MSDTFHRTNLNLHRSDYEFLLARYGFGWTTQVRDMIHEHVKELRSKLDKVNTNRELAGMPKINHPDLKPKPTDWRNHKFQASPPIDLDKLIREQEQ